MCIHNYLLNCIIYIGYVYHIYILYTYFQLPVPHSSEFGTGRRQVATGHEHPVVQPLGPEKGAPGREVGLVHVCHGDALDLSLSLSLPVRDLITTHYNSYLYITLYNIIELLMMYSFCEKKTNESSARLPKSSRPKRCFEELRLGRFMGRDGMGRWL